MCPLFQKASLAAIFVSFIAACTKPPAPAPDAGRAVSTFCDSDGDCSGGEICREEVCRSFCQIDIDCNTGQRCFEFECVPLGNNNYCEPNEEVCDGNVMVVCNSDGIQAVRSACGAEERCLVGNGVAYCEVSTAECPSGQTECSSVCTELESSREHCGACGKSCFGGGCYEGQCNAVDVQVEHFPTSSGQGYASSFNSNYLIVFSSGKIMQYNDPNYETAYIIGDTGDEEDRPVYANNTYAVAALSSGMTWFEIGNETPHRLNMSYRSYDYYTVAVTNSSVFFVSNSELTQYEFAAESSVSIPVERGSFIWADAAGDITVLSGGNLYAVSSGLQISQFETVPGECLGEVINVSEGIVWMYQGSTLCGYNFVNGTTHWVPHAEETFYPYDVFAFGPEIYQIVDGQSLFLLREGEPPVHTYTFSVSRVDRLLWHDYRLWFTSGFSRDLWYIVP